MNDKTLEELRYYFNGYGSRHDETILKLIDQNKRYREALEYIADNKIEHGWHLKAVNCVVRARKVLEEDLK